MKYKKYSQGFLFLIFFQTVCFAQFTQRIRGKVVDEVTNYPLPGASIIITETNPLMGTSSNLNGDFSLENVPVGRVSLKVSYIGYKDKYFYNLQLTTGKELFLTVKLEEKVIRMQNVVVYAGENKAKSLNEFSAVSARTFSVEEARRYAGSLGDPSRMAQNYAGVMSVGDSRNDIIIRGNSPMGLLWRMEGINIPNPNHFGATGTTGGPVTMLNNNLLSNSDFLTGAFPAEYGNALSGVFDLKMRNGNNEKYEFVGQVGFNGFELGAEGPFTKTSDASFLINYRYSTLAFIDAIGLKTLAGSSVPQYQDLTFKIHVPTKNYGIWSIFGIGGISFIQLWDSKKGENEASYGLLGTDTDFGSKMGVAGLQNIFYFNKNSLLKTSISVSGTEATTAIDSLIGNTNRKKQFYRSSNKEITIGISSDYTQKLSPGDFFNAGITLERYQLNYLDSVFRSETHDYFNLTNTKGTTWLYQGYFQWKHNFTNNLFINGGMHYQYFELNKASQVEPRVGIEWQTGSNILSFGYGLLSQTQPKIIYFVRTDLENGKTAETNRNMDFTHSNQYVIGYQYLFGNKMRVKAEAYYQALSDVPVSKSDPDYSILNEGAYFYIQQIDSLVNLGTGRNFGLEFTFEKFLADNFYLLATTSLFRSFYKGYNKVEHPTAFDNRFVINLLGGYEFPISQNGRMNVDLRGVYAGGRPYTPIDALASEVQNKAVYITSQTNSLKHPDYLRLDLKISYHLNGNSTFQEWGIEIQNVTDRQNVFQQTWDVKSKKMKIDYQQGFFPMFFYRIYF
jgi:hypothetical protein